MSGISNAISRAIVIGLVSLFTAACTTTDGYFTPGASVNAAQLNETAADVIASDMVARLAEHVGPGTGTIVLKADNSMFSTALDKHLRSWGYAVDANAAGTGTIALAYTVDTADGHVLTRISTPTVELARTYSVSSAGAVPASPLSVMRRAES
jgi:hypothetical protein